MFHRLMIVVVFLVGCCVWLGVAFSQTSPQEKIGLKILYAGTPGSPRETEFRDFLRDYFKQVDTADIATVTAKDVEPYDVLLIDSNRKVESLEKLIALRDDRRKRVLVDKVLERYLVAPVTPQNVKRWVGENRGRIFFTDIGGYKFMAVPKGYLLGD
ncbi:MAG: hypothetical protein FWD53_06415 [Phycisphaerales bacterium]|nr:hypothetical protein [Phycisphaerales bacterium]